MDYILIKKKKGCAADFFAIFVVVLVFLVFKFFADYIIDTKDSFMGFVNNFSGVVETVKPDEMAKFKTLKVRSNYSDTQVKEIVAALKVVDFPFDKPIRQNKDCITVLGTNRPNIKDEYRLNLQFNDGKLKSIEYAFGGDNKIFIGDNIVFNNGNAKHSLKNNVISENTIKLVNEAIKNDISSRYKGQYTNVEVVKRELELGFDRIYYKASIIGKKIGAIDEVKIIDGSVSI